MDTCNTLTICSSKSPEYYLDLIRHHFKKNVDDLSKKQLCLQALGLSCQNLVFVACLVNLKGYANYKRIKNDHLSVPVADSQTGQHLGLVKKVRLTVKLTLSDNFKKIIEQEEHRVMNLDKFTIAAPKDASQPPPTTSEEYKFDKEDLVLKSAKEAENHML
jgi:hypothetical protein